MQKIPQFSAIRSMFTSILEAISSNTYIKSVSASLTVFIALLRSRLCLLLLGIISEFLYFFYLLCNFPLLRYYQNYHTDLGAITSYSHAGFLQFVIVFSFLFLLFGLAWWEVHKYRDRATLWTILGFGGIFALTTSFVYPITATDIFNYIAQGLILVQYHANPIIVVPAHFARDPLMKLARDFFTVSSPYGPLDQLIQALPIVIAGRNVLASLLIIKFMSSALLIIEAFFIYKILSHVAPKLALAGALALAWNPFALLEYSANSHNDITMMLFVIIALFALLKEHHLWAIALITASALIKFASLPLILLFFIYSIFHQQTYKERIYYTIKAIFLFLALMIDSFALFWAGPQTLQRLFNVSQGYLFSFSIFLLDLSWPSLSYNQTKAIGWVLFGACYLYTLWLSSRDFLHMLKGCFIAMFALLICGLTYIQPWYLIWAFSLAILVPQTSVSLAAFFLVYSGTLTELGHAYIAPWSRSQYLNIFVITNSIVYLFIFFPPLLILLVSRFKPIFSHFSSSQE